MTAAELFAAHEADTFQDLRRPFASARPLDKPVPAIWCEPEMISPNGLVCDAARRQVLAARFCLRRRERALVEFLLGPRGHTQKHALIGAWIAPFRGAVPVPVFVRGPMKFDP